MVPSAARFAVLVNPNNAITMKERIEAAQTGAQRLGLELVILKASTAAEIETAFVAAIEQRASALLASDAYFESQRDQLAALGLRYRLPVCLVSRDSAMAGVLMSYGATSAEILRQAGVYVGRILRGEKPADLPVVQPTTITHYISWAFQGCYQKTPQSLPQSEGL